MMKVLKNKNFFLLFQGAFVSEVGNMLYNTAMGLIVLRITGSATSMGLFMALAIFVRVLFSPIAGVMVDRWNRVRIIYMTDFIRGFLFLAFAFILYNGLEGNSVLVLLYLVTALSSINAAFFFPAASSAIPEIVGENNLQAAQGLQGFLMSIPSLIGIAFGAALYDLGSMELIVFINAITFIFSGITEMFIRTPLKKEKTELEKTDEVKQSIMKDYVVSLKYIKKVGLLNLVLFFLVINFAATPIFSIGSPYLFKNVLMRENTMEYAFTGIMFSVSSMIGALIIGSMKIKSYKKAIPSGIFRLGFFFLINIILFHLVSVGLINHWLFYVLYMLDILALGINMNAINIPIGVGMTLAVDPNMRGRVFSTIGALSQLAIPFAMVLGGVLLDYGSITVLGVVSITLLIIPIWGFSKNKRVKELLSDLDVTRERLEEEEMLRELREKEEVYS